MPIKTNDSLYLLLFHSVIKHFYNIIFILFLLQAGSASAKGRRVDSVLKVTENFEKGFSPKDTFMIKLMNQWSIGWRKKGRLDTAYVLAKRAFDISKLFSTTNDPIIKKMALREMSTAYSNFGSIADDEGKYAEALQHYLTSLKLKEEIGDEEGQAVALNNAALILTEMGDHKKAFEYFFKAVEINKRLNLLIMLSKNYNNIGNLYFDELNFDLALEYYEKSLALKKSIGDNKGIAMSYLNMANVFDKKGNILKADSFFTRSLDIQRAEKNTYGIILSLNNLSTTRLLTGKKKEAELLLKEAFELNKKYGDVELQCDMYRNMAMIDSALGNFRSAFDNTNKYFRIRDQLKGEEARKKVIQMQMQYDFDKKETMQKLEQEKKDELTAKELQSEKTQRNYFAGGLITLGILLIFIYRSYHDKKRTNKELATKNIIIEEKQKEILDSIHYAKRIQKAQMPNDTVIEKAIKRLKK